jgi:hypothetical protein
VAGGEVAQDQYGQLIDRELNGIVRCDGENNGFLAGSLGARSQSDGFGTKQRTDQRG